MMKGGEGVESEPGFAGLKDYQDYGLEAFNAIKSW
jgi:hypothetical protein